MSRMMSISLFCKRKLAGSSATQAQELQQGRMQHRQGKRAIRPLLMLCCHADETADVLPSACTWMLGMSSSFIRAMPAGRIQHSHSADTDCWVACGASCSCGVLPGPPCQAELVRSGCRDRFVKNQINSSQTLVSLAVHARHL